MGGIPKGWLDYSKVGKPMKADNLSVTFLAFKVPLKSQLTGSLEASEVFGPADLLTKCQDENIRLKLIIDLTFTSRYYQPSEFTKAGVKYLKIPIEGQIVPKKARFEKFAQEVKKFLKVPENRNAVVGVHCTHGLNRTGYLICKYLIEHENMDPEEAINLFNVCRGHDMERENYLAHLCNGTLPPNEAQSYYDAEYKDSKFPSGNNSGREGGRHSYNDYRHQSGFYSEPSYYDQNYYYEPEYSSRHHHGHSSYSQGYYRRGDDRFSHDDYAYTDSSDNYSSFERRPLSRDTSRYYSKLHSSPKKDYGHQHNGDRNYRRTHISGHSRKGKERRTPYTKCTESRSKD